MQNNINDEVLLSTLQKGCRILVQLEMSETGDRFRNISPEVFLGKGVLKICSKFIGEHSC